MTNRIVASFNTDNYQPIRITYFDSNEGEISYTLTGSYFPFVSGTIEGTIFSASTHKFTTEITNLFSFATQFELGYLYQENKFYISCSIADLSFSEEASRIFGFDDATSVSYLTSSRDPYFIFISKETCYTNYSQFFEDYVPQRQSVADDGRIFAMSNDDNANFNVAKWKFTNEDRYKVFAHASSSLTPYTIQNHYQEMRSFRPWILFSSLSSSNVQYANREITAKFQGQFARFAPKPMFQDQYAYWENEFRVRVLSTGSNREPV